MSEGEVWVYFESHLGHERECREEKKSLWGSLVERRYSAKVCIG